MVPLRWLLLHGVVVAAALALPTAATAQLQINQNFVTQGPAPSFGPTGTVQSGDAPPNGNVAGAVGPVLADPVDVNTLYVGTPAGGIWKTTNGGTTWTPLTDKQASLSIASLSLDPTDPTRRTLIAGTGLTANGSVCGPGACFFTGSGGLQNGLLYSQDGGNTWTSLAEGANQSVVGVAARGNVMVAGTFEISGLGGDKNAGALFRSSNGGATFTQISGGVGTGLPTGPVSSIEGDPNNPNRLYAAVTAPNAAGNASTAIFVSNDTGATWTQVFGVAQSAGTIQGLNQTVIKIATGPGGAIAAGVVNLAAGTVTGLFWSGNSGATWTQLPLPTPTLNPGGQAPVNFAIAIDPNNTNLVYVSGDRTLAAPNTVTAFRINANTLAVSSITDANTGNGSTVHADARAITFDANGRLILTTDGTIYARTSPQNDTGVWTRLSGNISAFESYAVGYDAVGKRLITAAQDNGVTIQASRNAPLWNAVLGADGINAFVNDVTLAATGRTAFYATFQNLGPPIRIILDTQGNIVSPNTAFNFGTVVTCNGIACGIAVTGSSHSSPWVNNRVDPTRMAFGGTSAFVTQDTLTGAQGPAANTVDLTLTDLGPVGARVTKIAYGTRDNPNMLVAGADGGPMLWQSTTAAAGSIVPVPGYAAAGGVTPTGLVLDPRSQLRYFVADNTNLFGTTNQGGSFTNLAANLSAGIIRPTALEFISNNGVDALLVGGLNNVANAQSTIAIADSDAAGLLTNWRPFGAGLPNSQVNALVYNPTVDVLAVGTFGRGVFALYDVTSYFPQATVLQFGLADNDSKPDASYLTNGKFAGTTFVRPLNKYGTGTLTIAGNASYTGGTSIFDGILQLGTGGASGAILGDVGFCGDATNPLCNASTNKFLIFDRSDTYTFAGAISGPGQLVQNGLGTTILTANNTYAGATTINGGALIVDGSIASSALTTVNSGGLLGGVGRVGNLQINTGGTFAPGPQNAPGAMTVAGSLAFQSGALFLVQVNSSAASMANVTGTATLGGTVGTIFAPGTIPKKEYDILHAKNFARTFVGLVAAGLPTNFVASLRYGPNDVFLDLTAALGLGGGVSQNQVNVATAINGFFNNGGALPPNFTSLFGLTRANLATALSQLSGEAATGAQYGAFQLGNEFFSLMLDPLVFGGGPIVGIAPGGAAMRLAAEETQAPEIALAYAKVLKEPPAAPAPIIREPRWNVWAGGYGGTNRTQGDPVIVGSHDVTARTGGYGAGIDYRIWPGTTLGVALAGGFTNWGLANGLGGGNSDAFQAGLYGITRCGPAYLAGALAFAEHWFSTDRFAFLGDHLTARFNAQSYGGRIEGGWRFATFLGGVAPYAAMQAQAFHTSAYNELDATAGGFGLNYNARNGSDTRSELGARFDQALPIANAAVLALNARAAWAHDWVTNPSLMPVFQALPDASFIVNGATPVPNSALLSAGGELRFLNGWAIGARFDGEFADRAQTYAGTGTLRYVW